jgi:serine protease Do
VELSDPADEDRLTSHGIDALLGTEILRQFTLAFGPGGAIFLKPNRAFKPDMQWPASEVAFDLDANNRIIIDASLNGKGPFRLVVATNAGLNVVRPALINSLGLETKSVAQPGSAPVYHLDKVDLGGTFILRNMPIVGRETPSSVSADGELALSVLTQFSSRVDFSRKKLSFSTEGDVDLDGFTKIDSQLKRLGGIGAERLLIKVFLEGAELWCLVDSIMPASLVVNSHCVRRLDLWNKFADQNTTTTGGGMKVRHVMLDSAGISKFIDKKLPVILVDPDYQERQDDLEVDGVVGMGLLSKFNFAFDIGKNFYLAPRGERRAGDIAS